MVYNFLEQETVSRDTEIISSEEINPMLRAENQEEDPFSELISVEGLEPFSGVESPVSNDDDPFSGMITTDEFNPFGSESETATFTSSQKSQTDDMDLLDLIGNDDDEDLDEDLNNFMSFTDDDYIQVATNNSSTKDDLDLMELLGKDDTDDDLGGLLELDNNSDSDDDLEMLSDLLDDDEDVQTAQKRPDHPEHNDLEDDDDHSYIFSDD